MTIYLPGYRETSNGARLPIRVALDDIPNLSCDKCYFYGYSEGSGRGRHLFRLPITGFENRTGEVYFYGERDHGNGVVFPVRINVADIVTEVSDYVASAVNFDGSATLHVASLTAPETSTCGYLSMWFKIAGPPGASIFASDPENTYSNSFFTTGNPNLRCQADISPLDFDGLLQTSHESDFSLGDWHHVLMALDSSSPDGTIQVLIDGVDVTGAIDKDLPFNMDFNGVSYWALSDSYDANMIGDIADYFFCSGVNLLVGGSVPPANLALFRDADGKPVDPAVAVAALGTPQILFSGDHTAFATNQGSGGAFTLTGTLTDATTSPSD